jgi:FMN-dependent NADH-azoreductase
MFNFFGIEDYEIVRVQGTDLLDRNEVLEKGYKEAQQLATQLALK